MAETQMENSARYGFIYPIAKTLIQAMLYLSIVELFKAIGKRLAPSVEEKSRYAAISIDIFITFKWSLVAFLWFFHINNPVSTMLIAYLITTNLHIYFYHHVWIAPYDSSIENLRRRFITLVQSFIFNLTCFAYLYDIPFANHFRISSSFNHQLSSLFFSASRSMLVDFTSMTATTITGSALALAQTVTVFCFISILLSVSIPSPRPDTARN